MSDNNVFGHYHGTGAVLYIDNEGNRIVQVGTAPTRTSLLNSIIGSATNMPDWQRAVATGNSTWGNNEAYFNSEAIMRMVQNNSDDAICVGDLYMRDIEENKDLYQLLAEVKE